MTGRPPADDVARVLRAGGVEIMVPKLYGRAPELEVGPVVLVAIADPWTLEGRFRPNVTVEVHDLSPADATLVQLSMRLMKGQIALGRHVVSCDLRLPNGVSVADELTPRQIVSVYRDLGSTIVQTQHLSLHGDRAVVMTASLDAGDAKLTRTTIDLAIASLACELKGVAPASDPSTMPPLDEFVTPSVPIAREAVGVISRAQPRSALTHMLSEDDLDRLRRGKLGRRDDGAALRTAGLVGEDRRLTDRGALARECLRSPGAGVTVDITTDGDDGPVQIEAFIRFDGGVVVERSARGRDVALELSAGREVLDVLLRRLGVSPGWTFSVGVEDRGSASVNADLAASRLTDPSVPAPPGHLPALARMWRSRWRQVRFAATRGQLNGRVIMTDDAGSYLLRGVGSGGPWQIMPLPSRDMFTLTVQMSGFDV